MTSDVTFRVKRQTCFRKLVKPKSADLGACPVLHLDENLSRAHLGQLTDPIVSEPVFPCHMTHSDEQNRGTTSPWKSV